MNTDEFLKYTLEFKEYKGKRYQSVRDVAVMADGFSVSIQAGDHLYCSPRYSFADYYSSVELGFPSARDELIIEYAEDIDNPTETVYGYVPVSVVDELIKAHGGIVATGTWLEKKLITTPLAKMTL